MALEIIIALVLFAVGIVLIVKGGDWFVDAASWIAEVLGIPQFIVGATIVSFATTLPELLVSAIAAAQGESAIAIGNAVGSVTANSGLIMAIALIVAPFALKRKDFALQGSLLLASVALLFGLSSGALVDGAQFGLNMYLGILLFIPLVIFMTYNVFSAKKEMSAGKTAMLNNYGMKADLEKVVVAKDKKTIVNNVFKFVFGLGFIVGGAQLLVDYASSLAEMAGIPKEVISATIVAVGTSLPELVTMVTALAKKKGSMSVGNIIGANIIDITLILPICALIAGTAGGAGTFLPVVLENMVFDFPFCLGIVTIAILPSLFTQKFQRWQGISMLTAYVAYNALMISNIFVNFV